MADVSLEVYGETGLPHTQGYKLLEDELTALDVEQGTGNGVMVAKEQDFSGDPTVGDIRGKMMLVESIGHVIAITAIRQMQEAEAAKNRERGREAKEPTAVLPMLTVIRSAKFSSYTIQPGDKIDIDGSINDGDGFSGTGAAYVEGSKIAQVEVGGAAGTTRAVMRIISSDLPGERTPRLGKAQNPALASLADVLQYAIPRRILDGIENNESYRVEGSVEANLSDTNGHFDGARMMPGVLLNGAAAELGLYHLEAGAYDSPTHRLTGLAGVTITRPVRYLEDGDYQERLDVVAFPLGDKEGTRYFYIGNVGGALALRGEAIYSPVGEEIVLESDE